MKNQGFTLIELLVTVTVLAVLTMVALPAYLDYTIRVKVSEGLVLADSVKLAVAETHQSDGKFPSTNQEAGVPDVITSEYVDNITVTPNGIVTIIFNNVELGVSGGGQSTMLLTPIYSDGLFAWDCVSGGTLAPKFRPQICR